MNYSESRRQRRHSYPVPAHLAELDDDADEAERKFDKLMGRLTSIAVGVFLTVVGLFANVISVQLGG